MSHPSIGIGELQPAMSRIDEWPEHDGHRVMEDALSCPSAGPVTSTAGSQCSHIVTLHCVC